MIELILGLIVLLGALAWAALQVFAAGMSDGQTPDIAVGLWLTFGVAATIEIGLFLVWFAKRRGWN